MGAPQSTALFETQRHRGYREELAQQLCYLRASVFQKGGRLQRADALRPGVLGAGLLTPPLAGPQASKI